MKILVIDDDKSVRYMLKEICDFAGWKVVVCANGREGIKIFSNDQIDLVLVDFHMPEMDGLTTVGKIRDLNKEVPILVLTVDESQETANRFLSQGATDFALKPIKAPDLISRIRLHKQFIEVIKTREEVFVTKGISQTTITQVSTFLQSRECPCPISEIIEALGLSYPTIYRCLIHLIQQKKVDKIISYQKMGRPKNLYKWI
jgi:two-component system response regulator DctR